MADEQVAEAIEYWVRHLPSGTLSPVGERFLSSYENDPEYEFLDGPPGDVLATAWEAFETLETETEAAGWWIRPHGSNEAPVGGPYKSEDGATRAIRNREGSDAEIVVTPATPAPAPPTE
jgi:hypothetical protein